MFDKVSIIYNTCDKYESLWWNFFYLLKKYFPECSETKIIINTESKIFKFEDLKIERPTKNNEHCSWSQRVLNSLESISTPYVLMTLDDFYLKAPVQVEILKKCIQRMEENSKISLFTFCWQPGNNKPDLESKIFERRGRFAPYRVNAQIGLWRVSYLKKIMKTYENPWQFELNGSFRSSILGGEIYSLKRGEPLIFDYDWGFLIIRGKVNQNVAKYFVEYEGLDMSLPFDDFIDNEYTSFSKPRFIRLVKYFMEMIVSLFRK